MVQTLRFSLSGLIGAVLVFCLYLAALRHSSTLAAEAALSLTIAILSLGLLWAIFRPGTDRRFWTGFELCGWGYLLLAFSTWSQAQLSTHLVTTRLAKALHGQMPLADLQDVAVEWHGVWYPAEVLRRDGSRTYIHYTGYGSNWDEWVGPSRIRGSFGPFLHICHSLMSLILGLAGGVLATAVHVRDHSRRWFWLVWGFCTLIVITSSIFAMLADSTLDASGAISLLLVVLYAVALASWNREARDRSFALGFAIAGWGYFLLHFAPGLESSIAPHLLSTRLIHQIQDGLHPSSVPPPVPGGFVSIAFPNSAPYSTFRATSLAVWNPGTSTMGIGPTILAGHCLLTLLAGIVGGFLAAWISRRPIPAAPTPSTEIKTEPELRSSPA
jgi:hypothetical protein